MYKVLHIGDKDYKLEYSFEAAMYGECVKAMMNVLKLMGGGNDADIILGMADLPKTTIIVFYAGLLEHHGMEGDRSVPNIATAKSLARQYITEQGEECSFYTLMTVCTDQMGEDGFFKLVGLDTLMATEEQSEETMPAPKEPQDHKKRTRKTSAK